MLCLRPTASIARNPAQNASPAEIRRTARRESQHDSHHQRDAEELALRGHRVDLRVAHEGGGPGRDPRGGPAYGSRVDDAGAASDLPGGGRGGEHEERAAHRADEAVRVGTADGVGRLHQPDDRRRAVDEVVAVDRVGLGPPGARDEQEARLVGAQRPQEPGEPGDERRHGRQPHDAPHPHADTLSEHRRRARRMGAWRSPRSSLRWASPTTTCCCCRASPTSRRATSTPRRASPARSRSGCR